MTGVGKGVRLGQGSEICIEYRNEKYSLPGKIDGEPWLQKFPCTIQIRHFKQSPMLIKVLFLFIIYFYYLIISFYVIVIIIIIITKKIYLIIFYNLIIKIILK